MKSCSLNETVSKGLIILSLHNHFQDRHNIIEWSELRSIKARKGRRERQGVVQIERCHSDCLDFFDASVAVFGV